ncbi:DASH family cryptochrome [Altericista sp. CCNU0014]|uniref:DASH family cryptochrome n=1 Tax=Altericista sp. CCNU0014 TaxID=3082949 RepID=UPI00384BB5C8
MRILIWFRNDLRLRDHEPLWNALKSSAQPIPVYCFDPRQFGETSFGFDKTGAIRARFLRESVMELRESLRSRGSDLLVRAGEPEVVVPELALALNCEAVYFHQETMSEEVAIESQLERRLDSLGVRHRSFWGATLHQPEALPFSVAQIPELFTQFRKQVEADAEVAEPLPAPDRLPALPDLDRGECPTLERLGLEIPAADPRAVQTFKGGETEGIKRLQTYIWEKDRLRVYKETRNGMLNPDDSSKLSPWLAVGCLSPRYVRAQAARYEAERVKNDSTYWLVFELLWRDYFRWICAKHGDRVFRISGLRGLKLPWKEDWPRFELWRQGQTGYPLVDASMQELRATGYMSNRGRQNVASFLTKNLGINWQMGAEWFESRLIDYDVCSNWGNWNYTAGVGNDARGFRFFNILKQSKDYDPKGDYVRHWLPQLANIPGEQIHSPWKLAQSDQKRYGVRLGVDYPAPIVDLFASAKANEQLYNRACA